MKRKIMSPPKGGTIPLEIIQAAVKLAYWKHHKNRAIRRAAGRVLRGSGK